MRQLKYVACEIDGSFVLRNEIYLLEAKWQKERTTVADLRAFNGKIEDKASWSRGLFISYSGFSRDGLSALGSGKRFICMTGRDLHIMLDKEIPLDHLLNLKVRNAAETGRVFVPVTHLVD